MNWFYLGLDLVNFDILINNCVDCIFDFYDGRLLINNFKRNDIGFYKCYVSNFLG